MNTCKLNNPKKDNVLNYFSSAFESKNKGESKTEVEKLGTNVTQKKTLLKVIYTI